MDRHPPSRKILLVCFFILLLGGFISRRFSGVHLSPIPRVLTSIASIGRFARFSCIPAKINVMIIIDDNVLRKGPGGPADLSLHESAIVTPPVSTVTIANNIGGRYF